jgi:hypothetical protein
MVQIWVCSDACQNFAPNDTKKKNIITFGSLVAVIGHT